ncbi:L-Rhamnulokinase [bacterium HR27]|nr:L-Rhamnulokinase [bacterium HR27]
MAGPVEATAIGNLLVQAIALGQVDNLDDARAIVRASFPLSVYEPQPAVDWDMAYERFVSITRQANTN